MIQSQLNLVHEQVIKYLKLRIPNNPLTYNHSCPPCFYQEKLDGNHYRATVILNGADCYVALIDIPDVETSTVANFIFLKEIETQN